MDCKTRIINQSRSRHNSLLNSRWDKSKTKIKIKEWKWNISNFHHPKIHRKTSTLSKKEIWHPTLHGNNLHKWSHERVLVCWRIHQNNFQLVLHQKHQRSLYTSHQRCSPEGRTRLRQILERKQNLLSWI